MLDAKEQQRLMQQVKHEAAKLKQTEFKGSSQIVDLLEESSYALVTKNEQFIVKFDGVQSNTSSAMLRAVARLKITQNYF